MTEFKTQQETIETAEGRMETLEERKEEAAKEFTSIKTEDLKKLLLCARTCNDDYFVMRNLLSMKPLEDTAKDCINRMKFREPLFEILKKFKGYKI